MNSTTDSIEQTLGLNTPKQSSLKKYLLIGGALALLIGAIWFGIKSSASSKTVYITTPVQIKELTTTVSATGNLEPTNTIDVGIEVSGTVTDVLVDYNDRVKVGQLMARLDTTDRKSTRLNSSHSSISY